MSIGVFDQERQIDDRQEVRGTGMSRPHLAIDQEQDEETMTPQMQVISASLCCRGR